MKSVRTVSNLEECRCLWEEFIPQEQLSDLWEVRECFDRHYNHKPHFLVYENNRDILGFLPLSWNDETETAMYFPGETWEGKTWLEQNRLFLADPDILREMLKMIPGNYYLRYLVPNELTSISGQEVDETGYYFIPPRYGYDFDRYMEEFSGKSRKRIRRELESLESRGVEYIYDNEADFDRMVEMNIARYGEMSYFRDPRFLGSFRDFMNLLVDRGWMRMTTLKIGGTIAAVDLGCVYNGTYTLLAGGTSADFPGVAKLINLHHMRWACLSRIGRVDFLCGDFNWKTQFHLTPRPLYLLAGCGRKSAYRVPQAAALQPMAEPALTMRSANNA